MSRLDQDSLTRYYASQDGGSSYELMCDNVRALGHASVDCRTCSGKGYRELTAADVKKWTDLLNEQTTDEHRRQVREALSRASDCPTCKGSGKVSAARPRWDRVVAMDSMFTTVCCGVCRGTGEVRAPTDASAERQDVCLGCGGDGYIVPVTARCQKQQGGATGGSATDSYQAPLFLPAAPDPGIAATAERQHVAAKLGQLSAHDPQLAAALASYHGPESHPWVEHRWGRGFVLWQHTPPGQQLADDVAVRSVQRAGYLVAATDRLAEARLAVERPAAGRPLDHHQLWRVLVARADREARELQRRVLAYTTTQETAA